MTIYGADGAETTGRHHPPQDRLGAPFFEIGPKNLLRRGDLERLAWAAGDAGSEHSVSVVLTVPTALVAVISRLDTGVLVFGQGMDSDRMGGSVGRVTAEALCDAGAAGVMLNHDSLPLDHAQLEGAMARARETGLQTIVCASTEPDASAIATLAPTAVLLEPPELIGTSGTLDRPWITTFNAAMRRTHPGVLLMHAGGVSSATIARSVMRAGADGTGSTSGVLATDDYVPSVRKFVQATRAGWDEFHARRPTAPPENRA